MISYLFFNLDILQFLFLWPPMFQLHFKRNTSGKYIISHISLYQTFLKTIKLWDEIFPTHPLVIIKCDHFQDSVVNYGSGGMIYSCGLNYVVLIVMCMIWVVWLILCVVNVVVMLILVWLFACEDDSSGNPQIKSWLQEVIILKFPLYLFLYSIKTSISSLSRF